MRFFFYFINIHTLYIFDTRFASNRILLYHRYRITKITIIITMSVIYCCCNEKRLPLSFKSPIQIRFSENPPFWKKKDTLSKLFAIFSKLLFPDLLSCALENTLSKNFNDLNDRYYTASCISIFIYICRHVYGIYLYKCVF